MNNMNSVDIGMDLSMEINEMNRERSTITCNSNSTANSRSTPIRQTSSPTTMASEHCNNHTIITQEQHQGDKIIVGVKNNIQIEGNVKLEMNLIAEREKQQHKQQDGEECQNESAIVAERDDLCTDDEDEDHHQQHQKRQQQQQQQQQQDDYDDVDTIASTSTIRTSNVTTPEQHNSKGRAVAVTSASITASASTNYTTSSSPLGSSYSYSSSASTSSSSSSTSTTSSSSSSRSIAGLATVSLADLNPLESRILITTATQQQYHQQQPQQQQQEIISSKYSQATHSISTGTNTIPPSIPQISSNHNSTSNNNNNTIQTFTLPFELKKILYEVSRTGKCSTLQWCSSSSSSKSSSSSFRGTSSSSRNHRDKSSSAGVDGSGGECGTIAGGIGNGSANEKKDWNHRDDNIIKRHRSRMDNNRKQVKRQRGASFPNNYARSSNSSSRGNNNASPLPSSSSPSSSTHMTTNHTTSSLITNNITSIKHSTSASSISTNPYFSNSINDNGEKRQVQKQLQNNSSSSNNHLRRMNRNNSRDFHHSATTATLNNSYNYASSCSESVSSKGDGSSTTSSLTGGFGSSSGNIGGIIGGRDGGSGSGSVSGNVGGCEGGSGSSGPLLCLTLPFRTLRGALRLAVALVLEYSYNNWGGYRLSPAEKRRFEVSQQNNSHPHHNNEKNSGGFGGRREKKYGDYTLKHRTQMNIVFMERRMRLLNSLGGRSSRRSLSTSSHISDNDSGQFSDTSSLGSQKYVANASKRDYCCGAVPFTIQRVAEVLLTPERYYTQTHKLCNALEKLLLVTTPATAFGGVKGGDTSQNRREERELAAFENKKVRDETEQRQRQRRLQRRILCSSDSGDPVLRMNVSVEEPERKRNPNVNTSNNNTSSGIGQALSNFGISSESFSSRTTENSGNVQQLYQDHNNSNRLIPNSLLGDSRMTLSALTGEPGSLESAARSQLRDKFVTVPTVPVVPSSMLYQNESNGVCPHSFSPARIGDLSGDIDPNVTVVSVERPLSPSLLMMNGHHHHQSPTEMHSSPESSPDMGLGAAGQRVQMEIIIDPLTTPGNTSTTVPKDVTDFEVRSFASNSDIDSESDDVSFDDSASDRSDGSDSGPGYYSETFTATRVMALNRMQQQQQQYRREQYLQDRARQLAASSTHFQPPPDSEYQSGDSLDSTMAEDSCGSDSSSSDFAD